MDLSKILPAIPDVTFEGKAWRTFYTCDPAQDLFDDLVEPEYFEALHDVVLRSKPPEELVARQNLDKPFLYLMPDMVISWPERKHWRPGRWGDGESYPVWYGSLDERTSLREVFHHLRSKAVADFPHTPKDSIVFHRQVVEAAIRATRVAALVDLCHSHRKELLGEDYALCNQIGQFCFKSGRQGVQSASARNEGGVNLNLFDRSAILGDKKTKIVRFCFFRDGRPAKVSGRIDITDEIL